MPVDVKIQHKKKKEETEDAPPPAALGDYALHEVRGEGLKAMLLWLLFILVGSSISFIPWLPGVGIGIFVWWLVSSFGYFILGPRIVLNRLRQHGAEYEVRHKNQRLHTLLTKASKIVGIEDPEGFIVTAGPSQVRVLGGKPPFFIIVTQAALDNLSPAEIDCLALRAMIHIRLGHVRRLMLLQFLADTPPATRILVWPVRLYGWLLKLWWLEPAEKSADRLTLLMVKNSKLLISAILKMQAANDPQMQEAGITTEDVDNYVKQQGVISVEGTEISTQYKLGTAIQNNPELEDRIRELNNWAKSDEFDDAIDKLADARAAAAPPPARG